MRRKLSREAMRQRLGIGTKRTTIEPVRPAGVGGAAPRAPRWQDRASRRARDQQLQRQPMCELRLPGCEGRAVEVDHVQLRAGGGALTEPGNMRSTCASCHDQRHGKSRRPRIKGCDANGMPLDPEHPWNKGK